MTELSVQLRHAKRSNKKQISLSRRELAFIPKDIFTIKTLQELDLSDNKITAIEPNICQLFRLKTLNLEKNLLYELPQEIMQLQKLTVLLLKGNPLSRTFQILINLKLEDNVHNALYMCFQKQVSPLKLRQYQKGRETPSWLIQPDQSNKKERRQQLNRRKISKVQSNIQIEAERQAINGVLLLRSSDLIIIEEVSRDAFNIMHRGKHFELEVLIKKPINTNESAVKQYRNEIQTLSKYRHPNIVLMIGANTSQNQLCIALQMVKQGTLFSLLHNRKIALSQVDKRRICIDLINAISYLHKMGMVHLNLNSKDILVDSGSRIKLSGFGNAQHRSKLKTQMQLTGNPSYMSPQLLQNKILGSAADMFALGTLIYEIYSGEIPYYGLDAVRVKEKIAKDSCLPFKISVRKPIMDLINRCRAYGPQDRPKIDQLQRYNDW